MKYINKVALLFIFCVASGNIYANEREELLELKNTITNLIDELVTAGVLGEDKADLMKQTAAAKAKVQVAEEAAVEEEKKVEKQIADNDAVRVQYVPEHVKQDIRSQVRNELRQEVVTDVLAQAKNERWGVPDALPEWVNKLKLSGDIRVRHQTDVFSNDVVLDNDGDGITDIAVDFLALNDAQLGVNSFPVGVEQNPNQYFNERERSRNRWRERARLKLDAAVTTNLKVAARVTTGNINDPVSTNQTLGNDGERFDVQLDQAYIKFTDLNVDAYPWLTLWAGRFKNPFYSSNLVFDTDLNFQGLALGYKHNLAGGNSLLDIEDDSKTLFFNVGAFPLNEFEVSSDDKWLIGGQIGSKFIFNDQSSFKVAVSYYDYQRVHGLRNDAEDTLGGPRISFQRFDYTAPEFLQGGNTMFDIRNDFDGTNTTFTAVDSALYAIAPDYNLVNLTASYDWTGLAPIHLIFDFDFVKNVAYDKDEILERVNYDSAITGAAQVYQGQVLTSAEDELQERTTGYFFKLTAGWPSVVLKGRWQAFAGYKYLQRDAVLDAYTDSDFHLGGTNAKGFMIGGKYGINDFTWIRALWLSTDTIDGPRIGIDTLQIDLNAKF